MYRVRARGHSFSSRQVLSPMTKMRTGGRPSMPVSMSLRRWSYQATCSAGMSTPASGPKSTSPMRSAGPIMVVPGADREPGMASGVVGGRAALPALVHAQGAPSQGVVPAGDEVGGDLNVAVSLAEAVAAPEVVEGAVANHVSVEGRVGVFVEGGEERELAHEGVLVEQ